VSGNSAQRGGGLFSDGRKLTMTNCTVNNNGASVEFLPGGGGLYIASGNLEMVNCTVSGNSAQAQEGGGLFYQGGAARLSLANNIFAGNFANGDILNTVGDDFLTFTYNLIGNGTGLVAPPSGPEFPGNQIGTSASPIDPLLGVLAPNGGPTQTMAL